MSRAISQVFQKGEKFIKIFEQLLWRLFRRLSFRVDSLFDSASDRCSSSEKKSEKVIKLDLYLGLQACNVLIEVLDWALYFVIFISFLELEKFRRGDSTIWIQPCIKTSPQRQMRLYAGYFTTGYVEK